MPSSSAPSSTLPSGNGPNAGPAIQGQVSPQPITIIIKTVGSSGRKFISVGKGKKSRKVVKKVTKKLTIKAGTASH